MKFKNNLNVVRFFAAMLVLYGHSFVFLGLPEPLFLRWIPLGPLGVYIFFSISGYLVSESWDRDPSAFRFLIRRILRIIPGLAVVILLSVFILGPVVTTIPLGEYFTSPHTLRYIENIWLKISFYLPGVFEHLRVANAVNGSLWSLPIEFAMYLLLAIIGFLKGNRWVVLLLFISSALINLAWVQNAQMLIFYDSDLRQIFICGTYFWAGACLYRFNIKKFFSLSSTMVAIVLLLCLSVNIQWLQIAAWILIPFATLSFGLAYSANLNYPFRSGDYSYGIYIYAFPIQQYVVYKFPEMHIYWYIIICATITILFAALSWHLIEKRALFLKSKISSQH